MLALANLNQTRKNAFLEDTHCLNKRWSSLFTKEKNNEITKKEQSGNFNHFANSELENNLDCLVIFFSVQFL